MASSENSPQRVEFLDPIELARIHCDALHSSTHPPKMARPCLVSQEQAAILAIAYNDASKARAAAKEKS